MSPIAFFFSTLWLVMLFSPPALQAQTKIGKEQIEDAFLRKTGGAVYGDLEVATSTIRAGTLQISSDYAVIQLLQEGPHAVLRSNLDLYLDPTNDGKAGAVIVPATLMEFPDFLGDKIHFFSHSYKIGVSQYDLDITSDRNIKFHSDTVPDLMIIAGDAGDVSAKRDFISGRDMVAGNVFTFSDETEGDKLLLYGTIYRLNISPYTFNFYSDRHFKWHSDGHDNAMTLDADTGKLTLTGSLKLPVVSSLPSGAMGELLYYNIPNDATASGAYVYSASGWVKL